MGAAVFTSLTLGATAHEAFEKARDYARYYHGHGGYTGTIAEKSEFTLIVVPEDFEPGLEQAARAIRYANHLIDVCDPRIDDKWGPAGCIPCQGGEWLFFGCASK